MSTLYATISSNSDAVSLKSVFSKHCNEMLDTSTEEPLSDSEADTTPYTTEKEDENIYYFGTVHISDYYAKCLTVDIYKNIPMDMLYNPLDGTSNYRCICLCSDTEYYHYKRTPYTYSSIPIQKKFKEQYNYIV